MYGDLWYVSWLIAAKDGDFRSKAMVIQWDWSMDLMGI